jgi:hypothetical protein
MSIEAMKQALDFISRLKFPDAEPEPEVVMAILDKAIAEAEKQEPVAWYIREKDSSTTDGCWAEKNLDICEPLYTTPQQRKPLWIDPNEKSQAKFLPNIGEPVLFCHNGKTYYGRHTGGSFQYGAGVTKRDFNTWECRWMYLPAAHGIKE